MSDKTAPRKWTEDEQEDLRARTLGLLRDEDLTRKQAAAESGIPYGTLTPWLGGTYAGDGSAIAEKVERWIAARGKRQAIQGAIRATSFVETPTARQIHELLAYAQHAPDMVTVTGSPGTGKTMAVCQYTRSNPNVHKLVAEPSLNTVRSLLMALAGLLGVYDQGNQNRMSRGIQHRLAGTGALLVVDEAQHLSSAMLDQLRAFHDGAQCGVALVGNEAVIGRLEGGRRSAEYAQLYSRVGMRMKRRTPLAGDVEALLDAWGVPDADTRARLRAVSRHAGGLRVMAKTHRLAIMLASAEGGRAVSPDDVKIAFERLAASPAAQAGADGA